MNKIMDLENDGLNLALDAKFLYIRRKNSIYKYGLIDLSLAARNDIFHKDGKARGLSIYGDFVVLYDFCDLYILQKEDLQIVDHVRLGDDLSSDICGIIACDVSKVYVSIRNGRISVYDRNTKGIARFDICDASFWGTCVVRDRMYVGTVKGELIEIDRTSVQVLRRMKLTNKKNIYSMMAHDGMLYTVSLDKAIKVVGIESFEVVGMVKNAVDGMEVRILGIHGDCLVVAFRSKVSLWDIHTLKCRDMFDFPTNEWNKGIALDGNRLLGSDRESIYSHTLELESNIV